MKGLVVVGIVFAVLAAGGMGLVWVLRPGEGGVELIYTVSPGSGAEEAAGIIEHRARILAPGPLTARAFPDGRVSLRVGGLIPESVGTLRQAIERMGRAEVFAVARFEAQEKFQADGQVPPGHRAVPSTEGPVLLVEPPLLSNGDVNYVTTVTDPPNITIGLQLNEKGIEGVKRAPLRGAIATVLDGRLLAMTAVGMEIGGMLDLRGGDDREAARSWAASVLGREHRFPLRPPEVGTFRGKP